MVIYWCLLVADLSWKDVRFFAAVVPLVVASRLALAFVLSFHPYLNSTLYLYF